MSSIIIIECNMTDNEIYQILASKPHNKHHLDRYFKFILACDKMDIFDEYVENHHICPKASDLFPEYENLSTNRWNSIVLTTRQHIIAHIMLSLAYGGLQTVALHYMLNVQNSATDYNERTIPTCIQIRYAEKSRQAFSDWRKGKATFKDSNGKRYFLDVNSPDIALLGLVGNNMGRKHSEESKQLMRDTKYPNKTVLIHCLNHSRWIGLFSTEIVEYLDQGWSIDKTEDDYAYCKKLGYDKLSAQMVDRVKYMDQSGVYHGWYYRDDPIIEQNNLVIQRTEKQIAQNLSRTALATEYRTGTNTYNNGKIEKFLHEHPGDGWALGRLPATDECLAARKKGLHDVVLGALTYTNNESNIFVKPGDTIPDGFYLGMKHRDDTTYYYVNKDITEYQEFLGKHTTPDIAAWDRVAKHRFKNFQLIIDIKNFKIESVENAKEFVLKYTDRGKCKALLTECVTAKFIEIRVIMGLPEDTDKMSISKYLIEDIEPKRCEMCDSFTSGYNMKYCCTACCHKKKTGRPRDMVNW